MRTSQTLPGLAVVAAFLLITSLAQAGSYTFQTLDNAGDPAFNQLLGINNANTIAGYFGDGITLPNKGYTLTAPSSYTNENFPGSAQTQVVGIKNNISPTTVGFWIDGNGNNFGFVDQSGTFTSVMDPGTPGTTPAVNQLLGVNDLNIAAGFYVNGSGLAQGYLYNIGTKAFTSITDPNGVATTATGVNNAGIVTGFYQDAGGTLHGFIDNGGTFTTEDDPSGTNTMFLGLNNLGLFVGSYVDGSGVTQGFIYNSNTNTWQTISDPNASATPAFDVTGTTVNGINDAGNLVGFYSDGTNVNGFLALATPEPGTYGMMAFGGALLLMAGAVRSLRKS
jgi:hypothetical protein